MGERLFLAACRDYVPCVYLLLFVWQHKISSYTSSKKNKPHVEYANTCAACASSGVRAAMINCSVYNGTYLRHNHTCLPVSPDDVISNVTSLPAAAVDAVRSPTDDFFQ